eukprot:PhF_6_TR39005/c0_g1_i1/m.58373
MGCGNSKSSTTTCVSHHHVPSTPGDREQKTQVLSKTDNNNNPCVLLPTYSAFPEFVPSSNFMQNNKNENDDDFIVLVVGSHNYYNGQVPISSQQYCSHNAITQSCCVSK